MQAALVNQKCWRSNTNSNADNVINGEVNYITDLNSETTSFFTAESLCIIALEQYFNGRQDGKLKILNLYIDGNSLNWGFVGSYSLAYQPYPADLELNENELY